MREGGEVAALNVCAAELLEQPGQLANPIMRIRAYIPIDTAKVCILGLCSADFYAVLSGVCKHQREWPGAAPRCSLTIGRTRFGGVRPRMGGPACPQQTCTATWRTTTISTFLVCTVHNVKCGSA